MQWKVIGGQDKGGIIVREESKMTSPEMDKRLSFGSIVEEIETLGERLHYKLVEGTGPAVGWVSLFLKNKSLLRPLVAQKVAQSSTTATLPDAGRVQDSLKDKSLVRPPEKHEEELSDDDFAQFARVESVGGPDEFTFTCNVDEDPVLRAQVVAEWQSKELDGSEALYITQPPKTSAAPRLRIICFPSEGSAGSVFVVRNTPLLHWAEQDDIEICALNYPGRAALRKLTPITSPEKLAKDLVAALFSKLSDQVPYVIWGHSVGTWIAFEFLIICRKIALPMPKTCFFIAFPAPHLPPKKRPWSSSAHLTDDQLKEELVNWDGEHYDGSGRDVFEMPLWLRLMRNDRKLFAKYVFRHSGAPKFEFPIHAWHLKCKNHNFIRQSMVGLWEDWTIGEFETRVVDFLEHVSCLYSLSRKRAYFSLVVEAMKARTDLFEDSVKP